MNYSSKMSFIVRHIGLFRHTKACNRSVFSISAAKFSFMNSDLSRPRSTISSGVNCPRTPYVLLFQGVGTPITNNSRHLGADSGASIDGNTTSSDPVNTSSLSSASEVPYIPEPPPIPPDIVTSNANEIIEPMLSALGEPTLASLGLASWSPPGMVQQLLEFMHVTGGGTPWWLTIVYLTAAVRLLVFPLVINAQKNAAHMTNNMPQMQVLQMKLSEARQSGNYMDSARYANELMEFMKSKNISPLKNMIVPLAQAPVFVSVFLGLRQMANYPVESLATGGLWWFTDLTVPDPYYILPLITCCTMYLTIKLGAEGASLASQQAAMMRYVLKGMPIVLFPFIMNFPGAILIYWVATNFISLIQVSILRIPAVRAYFRIPKTHHYDPDSLPMKKKGFSESMKESWTNMKVARELSDRQRIDDMKFRDAGTGPLVKTYKYDPTKQKTGGASAMALKSRQT